VVIVYSQYVPFSESVADFMEYIANSVLAASVWLDVYRVLNI